LGQCQKKVKLIDIIILMSPGGLMKIGSPWQDILILYQKIPLEVAINTCEGLLSRKVYLLRKVDSLKQGSQ
jgi:hypothetical protein